LFMTVHMGDLSPSERQSYLLHLVTPRPIALASTIDEEGNVNLSPFSFFNVFSCDPPILIFSPSRRLRNNTTKHTLDNIRLVPQVAVSMVDFSIVHQVSLASCDYEKGTDEFIKAGFTKRISQLIAPPIVAEAKISFECSVKEIKSLGANGGAGQLVIAEVLCMHIADEILTPDKKVDQKKTDHVARLGGNWYARITSTELFQIDKPNANTGVGFDNLPEEMLKSEVLTGNHLAQLANVATMPVLLKNYKDDRLDAILQFFKPENNRIKRIHSYAKELIDDGKITQAWQVLLFCHQ
jgi:flavin reductase (DIM6/NTAB) family NADH-FMN oxidoreductase RutF